MVRDNFIGNSQNGSSLLSSGEELQIAHSLLSACIDVAFCLQEDAQFVYVNDAACWLLGYSRTDLCRRHFSEVYIDFASELWFEQWRSLKQQGSLQFHSRYQTKSGRIAEADIIIKHNTLGNREFACGFAYSSDNAIVSKAVIRQTSNQIQATQQLRRENLQLKKQIAALQLSLPDAQSVAESTSGVATICSDQRRLSCNQRFAELWCLPPHIALSQNFNQCLAFCSNQLKHPEAFLDWIQRSEDKASQASVIKSELKDGRVFKQSLRHHQSHSQTHSQIWCLQEVESASLNAAQKNRLTDFYRWAESTNALILIFQKSRLYYVNPATERLTGYTFGELAVHPQFCQIIEWIQKRQFTGSSLPVWRKLKFMTKHDGEHWLHWTAEGFEFESQSSILMIATDITQSIQTEAKTQNMLERQLALTQHKDQLISLMSHQFRTPLNLISFSVSLLKRYGQKWSASKKQPYLSHIQSAVDQLSRLIEKVAILNRLEAGKLTVEPKLINLQFFCHDLITQMRLSDCNQHQLKLTHVSDQHSFYTDQHFLRLILESLLENACKYSLPDSTVELVVDFTDKHCLFQVEDAGIGIPFGDQPQIFDPFYRGSNVGDIEGNGLGLSIVRKLVNLCGGHISATSQVGRGTTLTVRFTHTIP